MKKIEAFIRPRRLSDIVTALHGLPRFHGFTVLDAHGQGHGRGEGGCFVWTDAESVLLEPQVCLVVVCDDGDVAEVVAAIHRGGHTGRDGDGLIVVTDVVTSRRIRDAADCP